MYLNTSRKKGISSCQLAKDLSISQKTAWFMLHRIRESLRDKDSFLLKNIVETDEIYIGGKQKNMSNKKRAALKESTSNFTNKIMVMGLIERGGNLRFEIAGFENNKARLSPIIAKNIDKSAVLMTDSEPSYFHIGKNFAAHYTVNHTQNEYVRDGIIHTNTIEGAFGLFRRTIIGTYHKLSPKHLSRYCDEQQYRYNSRGLKDGERFEQTLSRIESRLSWKQLTKDNGLTAETVIYPEIPQFDTSVNHKGTHGKKQPIYQILDGKIVGKHISIKAAALAVKCDVGSISQVLRGKRNSAGGYKWKYV